jgi:hypothetical protein
MPHPLGNPVCIALPTHRPLTGERPRHLRSQVATTLIQVHISISYWKTNGAPAPATLPLTQEEFNLAASLNQGKISTYGITDANDWDDVDPPQTSSICLTHVAPHQGSAFSTQSPIPALEQPLAPKKLPKPRARVITDMRGDFLDEDKDSRDDFTPAGTRWPSITMNAQDSDSLASHLSALAAVRTWPWTQRRPLRSPQYHSSWWQPQ